MSTQYGKPIYHNGEFDGYDWIEKFCDDCGSVEVKPNDEYDDDLCSKCYGKRIEQDIKDGVIAE